MSLLAALDDDDAVCAPPVGVLNRQVLAHVVQDLQRARRDWRARQHRPEYGGRELPSREAVDAILCALRGVLFPMRLGPIDLRAESEDFYVGYQLDIALNALLQQVRLAEVIEIVHQAGVRVLVDGAQAVSHMRVDVQALDADFYVFSGHKVFGPTGIGAFYAKPELLEQMPPWQGGGNMIADVTFEQVIFQPAPNKFEAGTGNIADAVGLGAAIEYVERLGMDNIARYEHDLLEYGTHALQQIQGLRLIGTAREKASVMSFVLDGYSTEQVGKALNQEGIAVRTGHHCAQPILRRFGVEATVRPSLAFYNTTEEIDRLVAVLHRLKRRTRWH